MMTMKAAAQETSSLGAPGYSDFCGAVNSTQGETLHHILAAVNDDLDADGDDSFSSRDWHTDTIIRFDAYLIFVTGATGSARVNFFWPV